MGIAQSGKGHIIWSMESAFASTIQQVTIVSSAHHFTMTSPGSLLTAQPGPLMNVRSANAMGTQTAATSSMACGWRQGSAAEECVTTANTTQRGSTARDARLASTEIPSDPSLLQIPANLVPAILLVLYHINSVPSPFVTRATGSASVSPESGAHTVTSAWWDIGALENTAADRVTVLGAVIHSLGTALAVLM